MATSQRPYLLRAMHEWMIDNGETPHVVVDVSASGVNVPMEYAKDDKIILNISYSATSNLDLGNELISFDGRFSGVRRHVRVPVDAILGIFAKGSGQGMIFSEEGVSGDTAAPATPETAPDDAPASAGNAPSGGLHSGRSHSGKSHPGKSHLRVVK